jgi:hypothetical protein
VGASTAKCCSSSTSAKLAANQPDEAAQCTQGQRRRPTIWGKPLYKLGLDAMKKGNNSDATKLLSAVIAVDMSPEAALAKSSRVAEK